jgi:hypothetical protein
MSFVIMRLSRGYAWSQRQDRLGTVERLHLTFLIHTQDNRAIGWIHIQPDDVPYVLDELRVFEEF